MFIHIDLDCYFVSAQRVIDKSLLGIPVAVGGKSNVDIFSNKKVNRKRKIPTASPAAAKRI